MLPAVGATPNKSRPRSFEVTELLGQGGFAKVYRATPLGKRDSEDVAIKILNDGAPPDDIVQRFRDEARILGMLDDEALVHVEPAVLLNDRWAVVMEFVPGANCGDLLKHLGPMPVSVALEIVKNVAATLGRLYYRPGPDGYPLRLIHRDIKPSNIQLTHRGEVKLLDFGVARASFENREAHTTRAVQGTYGYIAPERLKGIDSPSVDTYGLGMVLYKLVTGGPTKRRMIAEFLARSRGAEGHALALANEMAALEPEQRPTLRDVATCCEDLLARTEGTRLAAWAQRFVPERVGTIDDPLVGSVLSPTRAGRVSTRPARNPGRGWRRLVLAVRAQLPFALGIFVFGSLMTAAWIVASLYDQNPVEQWRLVEWLSPRSEGLEPTEGASMPGSEEAPD